MHSSRARRHHRYGDDDDLSPVARPDDRRAESYTRSQPQHISSQHGRVEAYADSSTSRRGYPASSSHHHRSEDWTAAEASYSSTSRDRYRSEGYSHSRRDDYVERVDDWPTRPSEHASYSEHSRQWTTREDASRGPAPYTESRSYPSESRHKELDRKAHDEWPREENRSERERSRYGRDDHYSNREWRTRDEVRAEEASLSRKALDRSEPADDHRQWRTSNHERSRERSQERDRSSQLNERQWEPAPSWKNRGRTERYQERYDLAEPKQSSNRYNKKLSKAKKKPQEAIQKLEGRGDDMNNWQKRERATLSNREFAYKDRDHVPASSAKRKHGYSPDSRSRSPVRSVHSKHSSYRSRSRSASPRRPTREVHPHHKEPAYKQGDTRRNVVREKPSTIDPRDRLVETTRGRTRRMSISSVSSRSRSRSRSSSGGSDARKRSKHRLPTATSLRDIERQAKIMRLSAGQSSQRPFQNSNGTSATIARKAERRLSAGSSHAREAEVSLTYDDHEAAPQSALTATASSHHGSSVRTSPTVSTEKQANGVKRHAGFKPIGGARPNASASIKRFFPGDDDEETGASPKEEGQREKPTSPVSTRSREPDKERTAVHYSPRERHVEVRDDKHTNGRVKQHFIHGSQADEVKVHGEMAPPISNETQIDNGHREERHIPGSNDQLYAIVSQVGEGTFGKVYKARNTVTGVHVALKRIRMETERDGFPVTAMREIKLLQSLRHVNVVQLMEMMVHRGSVYMVFEYMDHDLTGVLTQRQFSFTNAHLKSLCQQMLQGLSYLHRKAVIHRDIKGSNILLNNRGVLKIADFGLARFYQKRRRADYTNRVITLCYRPPELLLGTTAYGPEVDMWSAGCIMLELFYKSPVFPGNDEIHQLDVVYKVMGTPTVKDWPGLVDMPWYELVKPRETIRNRFRELFQKDLSPAALDLAERLLSYDPTRRATADQALEALYFSEEQPPPMLPELSALVGEWHEFEAKRERAKKRRKLEDVTSADSSAQQNQ